MKLTEEFCSYCPHCGNRMEIDGKHVCFPGDRVQTAKMFDALLSTIEDPMGYLWMIRIAHRLRQSMNGLEKYRERAQMARRVLELFDRRGSK